MLLCTAMWLMFSHVFNFSDVIIILNRKLPSETDDVLFTQPPPTPPSCYCCSTLGLSTSPSLTRIHVLTPSWNASSLLRPRGRRYVTSCSMTSRARHPPGDCPTRGLWWRHRCGERMVGGGGGTISEEITSFFILLSFTPISLSCCFSMSVFPDCFI